VLINKAEIWLVFSRRRFFIKEAVVTRLSKRLSHTPGSGVAGISKAGDRRIMQWPESSLLPKEGTDEVIFAEKSKLPVRSDPLVFQDFKITMSRYEIHFTHAGRREFLHFLYS
jgi:hypothetical protein